MSRRNGCVYSGGYEMQDVLDALRDLVTRCDGAEGVREDGSNIDTTWAHAALGDFEPQESEDEG